MSYCVCHAIVNTHPSSSCLTFFQRHCGWANFSYPWLTKTKKYDVDESIKCKRTSLKLNFNTRKDDLLSFEHDCSDESSTVLVSDVSSQEDNSTNLYSELRGQELNLEYDIISSLSPPVNEGEYVLNIEKMIKDVGQEIAPVISSNYDEVNPIKRIMKIETFIRKYWLQSNPKLYLHQWQFPLSKSEVFMIH